MRVPVPEHLKPKYESLPKKLGWKRTFNVCPLCGHPIWSGDAEVPPGDERIELVMDTDIVCDHCEQFATRFPDVYCQVRKMLVFFAEMHGLR